MTVVALPAKPCVRSVGGQDRVLTTCLPIHEQRRALKVDLRGGFRQIPRRRRRENISEAGLRGDRTLTKHARSFCFPLRYY